MSKKLNHADGRSGCSFTRAAVDRKGKNAERARVASLKSAAPISSVRRNISSRGVGKQQRPANGTVTFAVPFRRMPPEGPAFGEELSRLAPIESGNRLGGLPAARSTHTHTRAHGHRRGPRFPNRHKRVRARELLWDRTPARAQRTPHAEERRQVPPETQSAAKNAFAGQTEASSVCSRASTRQAWKSEVRARARQLDRCANNRLLCSCSGASVDRATRPRRLAWPPGFFLRSEARPLRARRVLPARPAASPSAPRRKRKGKK